MPNEPTPGTIKEGEYHPSADSAMEYMNNIPYDDIILRMQSLIEIAKSGSRLGQICAETLDRMLKKQPVADRYLLGLAWTFRDMDQQIWKATEFGYRQKDMVRSFRNGVFVGLVLPLLAVVITFLVKNFI